MPATTYLANTAINKLLRNQAYSPPATIYGALFTTATDAAGGGTEATGGGYARVAVTLAAASGGATSNTGSIAFTVAAGTYVAFAIMDASTAGNMLWQEALPTPLVSAGGTETIPTGDLDLTIGT